MSRENKVVKALPEQLVWLFTKRALAIPWRDWAKDKAIESVVLLQPMGIEWQVVST